VSLDAMIEKARREPAAKDELFQLTTSAPAHAFKLLVATARIDGEITDAERELLVVIASVLGITGDRFATLYREAIDQADQLRRNR
jgi:tellurite resistance protein